MLLRIVRQEARIARQKVLIAELDANGAGTGSAQRLLAVMEHALAALRTTLSQYRR